MWLIKACGPPDRDYQEFPAWTYLNATDTRDTTYGAVLEPDEVDRRLPCAHGKLRSP